jgi:hypothetical protein
MAKIYSYSGREFAGPEDELYRYLMNAYMNYMSARDDDKKAAIATDIHLTASRFLKRGLSNDDIQEVDESARKASGYIDYIAEEKEKGE